MAAHSSKPKSASASTARSAATKSVARKPRKPKLLSSKLSFQGRVFNVFTDILIEPSGHRHTKDVIRHNGSVVMLAVDERKNPADPDIILERQYRHAAGQFMLEQLLSELRIVGHLHGSVQTGQMKEASI